MRVEVHKNETFRIQRGSHCRSPSSYQPGASSQTCVTTTLRIRVGCMIWVAVYYTTESPIVDAEMEPSNGHTLSVQLKSGSWDCLRIEENYFLVWRGLGN